MMCHHVSLKRVQARSSINGNGDDLTVQNIFLPFRKGFRATFRFVMSACNKVQLLRNFFYILATSVGKNLQLKRLYQVLNGGGLRFN